MIDAALIIQRNWRAYRARRFIYDVLMYVSLVLRGEMQMEHVPRKYQRLCKIMVRAQTN